MELTPYQDKCCHVALAAMIIWTHLEEAVKFFTTYCCHVVLVLISFPDWNKDIYKKRLVYGTKKC